MSLSGFVGLGVLFIAIGIVWYSVDNAARLAPISAWVAGLASWVVEADIDILKFPALVVLLVGAVLVLLELLPLIAK